MSFERQAMNMRTVARDLRAVLGHDASRLVFVTLGAEAAYFLSGYAFWYGHNILSSFGWSGEYAYFPTAYCQGFIVTAIACVILIPALSMKIHLTERTLLLLLFSASLINAISLHGIPEVNPDATLWYYQARFVAANSVVAFLEGFGTKIVSATGLPIPSLILGLAYKAFGPHRIVIQIVNAVFFGLVPVLGYLTAKQLFSGRVAAYTGIILISSPFMVSQAPLLLVDIISTFFVGLSIYLFVRMSRSRSALLPILAALAVGLTILSKITLMFFIVPAFFAILCVQFFRSCDRCLLLRNGLIFLSPFVAIAFLALPIYARIIGNYWRGIDPLSFASHPLLFSANPAYVLTFGIPKGLILSVSIPVFAMAVLSLCYLLLKRETGEIGAHVVLVVWIVLPTVYLFAPLSLNSAARYVMPTFPAYAILAASLISRIRGVRARRMILASILILSITSAHLMYGYAWSESVSRNVMYTADFLQQNVDPGSTVRVCSPHMAAWMSIYTGTAPPSDFGNLNNFTLFQCLNPAEPLPGYLVLVNAWARPRSIVAVSYPSFSQAEMEFLNTHYAKIRTLQGGSLEGPWIGMTVEVYQAR